MTKLVLAEEEKRMEGQAVELAAILLQRKGDDPHEGVVSLLSYAFEHKTQRQCLCVHDGVPLLPSPPARARLRAPGRSEMPCSGTRAGARVPAVRDP